MGHQGTGLWPPDQSFCMEWLLISVWRNIFRNHYEESRHKKSHGEVRPRGEDHRTDTNGSKAFIVTIKSKFTTKSAQYSHNDTQNTARKWPKRNSKASVSWIKRAPRQMTSMIPQWLKETEKYKGSICIRIYSMYEHCEFSGKFVGKWNYLWLTFQFLLFSLAATQSISVCTFFFFSFV